MGYAVFGGEKLSVEDFTCVATGELAGFADGMEDLAGCGTVDGEIVDGFVDHGRVCDEGRLRKHTHYSFGVWERERFAL